jgi:hypothetical protein
MESIKRLEIVEKLSDWQLLKKGLAPWSWLVIISVIHITKLCVPTHLSSRETFTNKNAVSVHYMHGTKLT